MSTKPISVHPPARTAHSDKRQLAEVMRQAEAILMENPFCEVTIKRSGRAWDLVKTIRERFEVE